MTLETKLQDVTKDCLYSQVRNTCSSCGVYQNSQSLLSGRYTSHDLTSAIHTKKEEGKLSQQKILRDWIMFRIIVAPNPSETFFYKKSFSLHFTIWDFSQSSPIFLVMCLFLLKNQPSLASKIWHRSFGSVLYIVLMVIMTLQNPSMITNFKQYFTRSAIKGWPFVNT